MIESLKNQALIEERDDWSNKIELETKYRLGYHSSETISFGDINMHGNSPWEQVFLEQEIDSLNLPLEHEIDDLDLILV